MEDFYQAVKKIHLHLPATGEHFHQIILNFPSILIKLFSKILPNTVDRIPSDNFGYFVDINNIASKNITKHDQRKFCQN